MKKRHGLLFGSAALLTAALFTLASCGNSSSSGASPGPTAAQMNEADFGAGAAITEKTIGAGESLQTYLNSIKSAVGNHVINLTGTHAFSGCLMANGVKLSLRGKGTIYIANSTSPLVGIKTGAELIIRGTTLQGKSSAIEPLVDVDGGRLTLHTGTITGNVLSAGLSSGGGGVLVRHNGIFTMNGGEISGNTAWEGGGVAVVSGGIFTMNGGTISGNTAVMGGGVFVGDGTFSKIGGTIYGDTNRTHTPGATENTSTGPDNRGHAALALDMSGTGSKYRNATAGPTVNLHSGTATNWGM